MPNVSLFRFKNEGQHPQSDTLKTPVIIGLTTIAEHNVMGQNVEL